MFSKIAILCKDGGFVSPPPALHISLKFHCIKNNNNNISATL